MDGSDLDFPLLGLRSSFPARRCLSESPSDLNENCFNGVESRLDPRAESSADDDDVLPLPAAVLTGDARERCAVAGGERFPFVSAFISV